ncbi:MAG: hypothetical protein PCFJNLEI_01916 [Verrucomicrobiae bacterium]|nr:hypothetical protein [Verrucomicrobiae bacterium]
MREAGFNMLLSKFSNDAKREIQDHKAQVRKTKRQAAAAQRVYRLVKFALLGVALVGVGVGLYFARDLGSLAGEMSLMGTPDPTLRPVPKPVLSQQRKLAELRKQREADLAEIE